MATTTRDILTLALQEIGAYAPGETLSAGDADTALRKLHDLLDNWNAQRSGVYAEIFESFTLVPSLNPQLIGPSVGPFTVDQRPVTIDGCSLILTDVTPNVRTEITVRDAAWYQELAVPSLEATIPTDVYYEPRWPNGYLYFWPVPTVAYDVELMCRMLLSEPTIDQSFSMPPGYRNAITLTLAEDLAAPFGRPLADTTILKAKQARARIFANNDETPNIGTQDAGMPSSPRPYFNYLIGR